MDDQVLLIIAGSVLILVGAVIGVSRGRRRAAERREQAERAGLDRLRKAFETATVTVHDIERLGLKDAELVEPVLPELPYVIEVSLTVTPSEELAWEPAELGLIEEQQKSDLDLGASFRVLEVLPVREPENRERPTVGAERLKLTLRSRTPGPAFRLEYGGAVFGTVSAHGATVRATRPIPASLRAPAVALMVGPPPEPAAPPFTGANPRFNPPTPFPDWHAPKREGEPAGTSQPAVAAAPSPPDGQAPQGGGEPAPAARPAVAAGTPKPKPVPPALREPTPPPATAILGGSSIGPRRANARPKPPPPRPSAEVASLNAVTPPPWEPLNAPFAARVSFEVFGTSSERFEPPPIEGLDAAGFRPKSRAKAPERFQLDVLLRDSTEPPASETKRLLEAAEWVHTITLEREVQDLSHLAQALTVAASVARECSGVVRDAITGRLLTHDQARRVLKSRKFAIVDHVVVASTASATGSTVRTRGLVKFGGPELLVTDVPKEHVRLIRHALLTLADLTSQGRPLAPGVTIQLGPAVVALVPHAEAVLRVCDADPLTLQPRAGLMGWIDAAVLAG